jgi:Cu/Zn superoxide dismutase
MKTPKLTRGSLAALALAATAAIVTGGPTVASADSGAQVVTASAPLTDLSPTTADPTDGASARLVAVGIDGYGTRAVLIVTGLDPSAVGTSFGAHVHTGPCVAAQPALAGPHYNAGGPPSLQTEVWLDFTVLPGGVGAAQATVPFTIPEGKAQSVVIHRLPTDANGVAGARMACLPAQF